MMRAVDNTRVRVNVGHGRERLSGVDLGDDRPVQPLKLDRCIGLQRFLPEVVVLDDRAALAALSQAGRLGRHRLHKRGAPLADGFLSDIRGRSRVDDVALELLGILQEHSRVRPHQVVGSDQERLAGPAHPRGFPLPVRCHQTTDLGDRELQCQNAFHSALRPDRRHHPGRWLVGGLVIAEVGDTDVVDGIGGQRLLVGVAQLALAVGAGENVGAEVDTLVGAVDHVAAGVEQQRVLELEAQHDLAEEVVVAGIGRRPGTAVPGVVQPDRLVPVGERCRVVGLQVLLCIRRRQQSIDTQPVAGLLLFGVFELIVVVVDDRLPLPRADRGVVELVECGRERLDGVGGRRAAGVDQQRILEI